MSDQHRPGGLTALAVLNFVFGGLALFGALGLAALLPLLAQGAPGMSSDRSWTRLPRSAGGRSSCRSRAAPSPACC
jgi:hypothetical protein